jgi:hypothetical protein
MNQQWQAQLDKALTPYKDRRGVVDRLSTLVKDLATDIVTSSKQPLDSVSSKQPVLVIEATNSPPSAVKMMLLEDRQGTVAFTQVTHRDQSEGWS